MAVRAALEAVKQHHDALGLRIAGEVDVDEIAIGRIPALARKADGRRPKQRRHHGLKVTEHQQKWVRAIYA